MGIENIDKPFGRITPLRISIPGLRQLFAFIDRVVRTDRFNDDLPDSPHESTLEKLRKR